MRPAVLLSSCIMLLAGSVSSALANNWCCGNVNYVGIRALPSNKLLGQRSVHYDPQGCSALLTGHWINCSFDFKILGVADKLPALGFWPSGYSEELILGGHYHYNGRPLLYPDITGVLSLDTGTIFTQTDNEITGETDYQDAHVLYPLPEEGGIIAVQDDIYTPPGWFCAYYCYDYNDFRWVEIYTIGYFDSTFAESDLVRLPKTGDDYIVVDNDGSHTDANNYAEGTYLRPEAMARLLKIAKAYHKLAKAKLSLNDMSLPVGGLFDLDDNWSAPHHRGHRDGIAVDINHTDGGGNHINCKTNNDFSKGLALIVQQVTGYPSQFKPYFCEADNNYNIHINLFDPFHPPAETNTF